MDRKTRKTGIHRAAVAAKGKIRNTGHVRRFVFRLLGPSASRAVVRGLLSKRIDKTPAAFPADLNRCSDILFILPSDGIEMIYQLETLFAIIGKYRDSTLTFVCPAPQVSFVSGLKNARVISYDPANFKLYGAEHNKVVKELSIKAFDICVMLERHYSLTHLYLVGVSRAHLRVGWDDGDCAPFLNVRLVESPAHSGGGGAGDKNLWDRNLAIARILNAEIEAEMRWSVQKSTMDEVAKLLNDRKLKKDSALIGIDWAGLEKSCGAEWVAELINALRKESIAGQFYIFGGMTNDTVGVKGVIGTGASGGGAKESSKDAPFPVLPSMSAAKTAALVASTAAVITGSGALLGLAQISSTKIVPVLTKEQAAAYCKRSDKISPVILPPQSQDPNHGVETVRKVVRNVKALLAS